MLRQQLEEEAATTTSDDDVSDELQELEEVSAMWERNVDRIIARWDERMINKCGVGCGSAVELLKDKVKEFRNHVKEEFRLPLAILKVEKERVEEIVFVIGDMVARATGSEWINLDE